MLGVSVTHGLFLLHLNDPTWFSDSGTTNGVGSKGAASEMDTPLTAATEGDGDGEPEVVEEIKPRALHKTASIFLRNLAPTITKAEVEAVS